MSRKYAGDVTPNEAWNILEKENTYLVDCRTAAEWSFVGVPDISALGKDTIFAEWVQFPGGVGNPDFVSEVEKLASMQMLRSFCSAAQVNARSRPQSP